MKKIEQFLRLMEELIHCFLYTMFILICASTAFLFLPILIFEYICYLFEERRVEKSTEKNYPHQNYNQ